MNMKLSDNEINQLDIIQDLNSEISILKDKLKRRNTQIADLKNKAKYVNPKAIIEILNYLDGRGIIYGDESLVKEALKDYKFYNK